MGGLTRVKLPEGGVVLKRDKNVARRLFNRDTSGPVLGNPATSMFITVVKGGLGELLRTKWKALSALAPCPYFTAQIRQLLIFTFSSSSGSRCSGELLTASRSAEYLLRIAEACWSDCKSEDKSGHSFNTAGGFGIEVFTG